MLLRFWDLIPTENREEAFLIFGTDSGKITSVYVLAAEVVAVEEHELDPVALVQRHQADEQQQDGAQTSGQLHRVHQLGWKTRRGG